jgi:hypothetical protein
VPLRLPPEYIESKPYQKPTWRKGGRVNPTSQFSPFLPRYRPMYLFTMMLSGGQRSGIPARQAHPEASFRRVPTR